MRKYTKNKIYYTKKLIDGIVIQKEGLYIAIPDKGYKNEKNFYVKFNHKTMKIESWHKAEDFRKFHDQFGGNYTLGYFLWEPIEDKYKFVDGKAIEI